ncbi:MAG: anti-sigma factor [Alicyclobacillaceae bacterium]|nr:anti-sigma factor [Alicyclobacillaceae bacterium]
MTEEHPCVQSSRLVDYLLDNLSDEDRAQMVRHVSDCPACRLELEELWPVHRELSSVPLDAALLRCAQDIKDQVLAQAFAVRPPVSDGHLGALTQGSEDRVKSEAFERDHLSQKIEDERAYVRTRRGRLFRYRVSLLGAATGAAVMLMVGIFLGHQMPKLPRAATLSSGQGATPSTMTPTVLMREESFKPTAAAPEAKGTLMLVHQKAGMMMIVSVQHMKRLAPDMCYNVWLVRAGHHQLAGRIWVNADGAGAVSVALPKGAEFSYVGITMEPWSQVAKPTTPKLMGVPLHYPL